MPSRRKVKVDKKIRDKGYMISDKRFKLPHLEGSQAKDCFTTTPFHFLCILHFDSAQ
jgi:hypothetical protein